MSKPKRERILPENEAKAFARMLRVSPQNINLVAQLIRGRKVAAALADLQFSRKRIAVDVKKCLESAIANAENNHDLDVDDARTSSKAGATAIVVSNHGGRQLDGAPSTISKLPKIVEAVGSQTEVLFDGGVRSGQDVMRRPALGARGCLVGRA